MSKRKAELDYPNQDLCEFLLEVASYEYYSNNFYKSHIHRKAADALRAMRGRIKNGYEAMTLPGIGKKLAMKIEEFLETGTHKELEEIRKDEKQAAISVLMQLPGIGPAKAEKLANAGIETLEDLKNHQDKLTAQQRIELRYFHDFEKKIPRDEVAETEKVLKEAIHELDSKYLVTICGSYRRGLDESEHITAVVAHPSFTSYRKRRNKNLLMKMIVECLEKKDLLGDKISVASVIFMGACRLPRCKTSPFRRLIIHLVCHDHYYCSTFHYTASDIFNKTIKAYAAEKKYTLNKHVLKSLITGKAEKITCEEDIFRILGLSSQLAIWKNPSM